jgi:DNA topoisomerase-1
VGVDPKTGKNLYAKIGRYGTLVQLGDTSNDETPRFASMKKGQSIETITLEEALALFELPRTVGQFEGHDVIVSIGKFGPYVRLDNKFYSLSKSDDPYEVSLDRCIEIIKNKRVSEAEKERLRQLYPINLGEYDGDIVSSNIGRYGPYLTYRNENYRLPKNTNPLEMTLDEAILIIASAGSKKPRGRKKKAE